MVMYGGVEKSRCPRGQRQAAAMALRAACNEIKYKIYTQRTAWSGGRGAFNDWL